MRKGLLPLFISLILLPCFMSAKGILSGRKRHFSFPPGVTSSSFLPKTVVIKFSESCRPFVSGNKIEVPSMQPVFNHIGLLSSEQFFPGHKVPSPSSGERGKTLVDLSLIYVLTYSNEVSLEDAVNEFLADTLVVYAEPYCLPELLYTPDDPMITNPGQAFLSIIKAYQAWDICKGDTSTVIGIVDTGTDWDHPDLASNVKINYADPVNGLDDDSDGYTDNYCGWDLGEDDNDPVVNINPHGSHVSGCADAVTDNITGVASPAFRCRFLPVKVSNAYGAMTKTYQGIVYAADHGCSIINCSWGTVIINQVGQDVVNYAVFNKDALVIAASGNNGQMQEYYPASFENVISVAATDAADGKAGFSNYSYHVDVCAPGEGIYTTYYNDIYAGQSGTSMAAPVASGCAAIIRSYFPVYNATQAGERLRVTCDDIYSVNNSSLAGMLGRGRVNLYSALAKTTPGVRIKNLQFTDNNDLAFVSGDTVRITGDIINYLDPSPGIACTLTSASPYVTILDGNVSAGPLGSMSVYYNSPDPFTVLVNPGIPLNTAVKFRLSFSDGTYNDEQYFDLTVNVDYMNLLVNDIVTSITSKGRLCYNGVNQSQGLGMMYHDSSLIYEAGLMIGLDSSRVSDNIRGKGGVPDDDFGSVLAVRREIPSVISDYDLVAGFNDNPAGSSKIGVYVSHRTFAWSTPPDRKYVILRYTIKNNEPNNSFPALYAGLFVDFDITDTTYYNNRAGFDSLYSMGYIYNTVDNGIWGAVSLLSPGPVTYYAIDSVNGGAGGMDVSQGFLSAQKYMALSTNRHQAGVSGNGNDVMEVLGTGPFNMPGYGDSVIVAFALIAGDSLGDLRQSALAAQARYDSLIVPLSVKVIRGNLISESETFPNPTSGNVIVKFKLEERSLMELSLFDCLGRKVLSLLPVMMDPGEHILPLDVSTLPCGFYYYRLGAATGKLLISR